EFALREFAPDTLVEVQNADVDVRVEGVPPIELQNVAIHGRTSGHGIELNATAASRYWNTMKLAGGIEYADLSSSAELHLVRISGQAWLDWALQSTGLRAAVPSADLDVRFHGDPAKALEVEVDGTAPTVTPTPEAQRFVVEPLVLKRNVG